MPWRLEAWNPEYAMPQALELQSSDGQGVHTHLEGPWTARKPSWVDWPVLYFVDGRLRVDAMVANEAGERALLLTLAIGALLRDGNGIRLVETELKRVLLHSAPVAQAIAIENMVYEPHHTPARTSEELLQQATRLMRGYEADLAARLPGGLAVVDGPLFQGRAPLERPLLGYAKSFAQLYLPPFEAQLLPQLQPGERTPVFRVEQSQSRRKFPLWVWFMRLPLKPSAPFHSAASLLRVETVAPDLEIATQRADLSVKLFEQMASSPARDPRAPQNLIPIGGLEQLLGRHMGAAEVVRRKIIRYLGD